MDIGEIKKDQYREFLESLKVDIGDFMRRADTVSSRIDHMEVRKSSITLRNKLKKFREISLRTEREMIDVVKSAKNKYIKTNIEG